MTSSFLIYFKCSKRDGSASTLLYVRSRRKQADMRCFVVGPTHKRLPFLQFNIGLYIIHLLNPQVRLDNRFLKTLEGICEFFDCPYCFEC